MLLELLIRDTPEGAAIVEDLSDYLPDLSDYLPDLSDYLPYVGILAPSFELDDDETTLGVGG